jgi:steroid delta-isomerase-like uncharacterized protein
MNDNNKDFVRRFYETAYIQHDLDQAAEMLAPSYVLSDPSEPTLVQGIEQWKEMQRMYLSAFPDHRLSILHQIAEGDFVLTHWSISGTHFGDLPGVPATQKPIQVSGMTLSRVANGKVAEEWQNWDTEGLLEQLGFEMVVPDIENKLKAA